MNRVYDHDVFGFLKTEVDVHTMGMATMSNLLRDCGYEVMIASADIMKAVGDIKKINNSGLLVKWIKDNKISHLSFSYRLDPQDGRDYFCTLYHQLKDLQMLDEDGGQIKSVAFAGLPDACV